MITFYGLWKKRILALTLQWGGPILTSRSHHACLTMSPYNGFLRDKEAFAASHGVVGALRNRSDSESACEGAEESGRL